MLSFGKALVTGGAGFIGSHLVERLAEEGCAVTVLDDFSSGAFKNLEGCSNPSSINVVKGTINDREILGKALKDVEVVFHQASINKTSEKVVTTSYLNTVNVNGTMELLECSAAAGVKEFIFASTAEVYGNARNLPIVEGSDPNPVSPLGWSKLLGERACFEFGRKTGMKTTALRYFNVYGERSETHPPHGVINEFAERLLSMESPVIYGKGAHKRDFVHVEDVVSANILAASKEHPDQRAYNVGSGEHISIESLAELESSILLGDNVIIPLDYKLARQIDIPNVYGDISLAKKDLGFAPMYSIEKGLEAYLPRLRNVFAVGIERPVPVRKSP